MIELLKGFLYICLYFGLCALLALIIRKKVKMPNELYRKLLHFILLFSFLIFLNCFSKWYLSVLACFIFVGIVYPVLCFFQKFSSFSYFVSERKKGELKTSLIIVFVMFAIVIAITWGLFKQKSLALATIFGWGVGDASAALFGRKFGKKKIYQNKTIVGTVSMFFISWLLVFTFLQSLGPIILMVFTSFVVSLVMTILELFTPGGFDTITCPLGGVSIMVLMLLILGVI